MSEPLLRVQPGTVVELTTEAAGPVERAFLLMGSGVVMTLAGLRVARPTLVDEELRRA